ncbi:MAG: hypothetical protein R3C19_18470 [Planctomycetaceae bacterium]
MAPSPDTPTPDDDNPYAASASAVHAASQAESKSPGPLSIVLSVVAGVLVGGFVFVTTFFVTCATAIQTRSLDNEFGLFVIFAVSGLAAIAALALTIGLLLKLVRRWKSRH